jgi:HlyD family secretion protein
MSSHQPTVTKPPAQALEPGSPAHPDNGNGDPNLAPVPESRSVSQGIKERLRGLDDVVAEKEGAGRSLRWLIMLGLLATLAVAGVGGYLALNVLEDPWKDLEVQPFTYGDVIFSVIEKGELEAANNVDIFCKVRASGRGNSVATSIRWVIDNGSHVRVDDIKGTVKSVNADKNEFVATDADGKDITLQQRETKIRRGDKEVKLSELKAGDEVEVRRADVLALLDDSALKDQFKSQISIVADKEAALIAAEVNKELVAKQGEIDRLTAENTIQIAEHDLRKYLEGDFIQKRKQIDGDLLQWSDKVATDLRMLRKGFITASQAQADQLKEDNLKEQLRVLVAHEYERNKLDWETKLAQAKANLTNVDLKAKGQVKEAESKVKAAQSVLDQEKAKLNDLREDIENCTILAPSEGMVVYFLSEESRRGFGGQQSMVAVGEAVRENQKLMRIPDLRHMQVQIKIHESLVPRLRADQTRKDGQGREEVINPGQPGLVRISAVDRPLRGHVKSVSPVSSQTDWMSTDVKTYPTVVTIDESSENLKPGMNAEVTILLDERTNVLRLPVHAVLEVAGERFCYVKTESGVEKRILKTGLNNSRFIEILEGSDLKPGELVVQTPRIVADKLDHLRADVADPADKLRGTDKGRKENGATGPGVNGATPIPGKPQGERPQGERPQGERPQGERPQGERRGPRGDKPGGAGPGFGGPGGPAGPGGPQAGPGAARGQQGGPGQGGFQMSPEEMEKRKKEMAEFMEKIKKAKPEERRKMIDQAMEKVPEAWREQAKERTIKTFKDQGIEIPD